STAWSRGRSWRRGPRGQRAAATTPPWRWVLFVDVPIRLLLGALAPPYGSESEGQPGRFDLAGALTSTAGMTALVYGFIRAAQDGWSDPVTVGSVTAAPRPPVAL